MNVQTKSKARVREHGEVYTNPREVKAMLQLVKPEIQRLESRILEPACGNGNFLLEILKQKLRVVRRCVRTQSGDYEQLVFQAVTTLYGIDILKDNLMEAEERLIQLLKHHYRRTCHVPCPSAFEQALRVVLKTNLIWGDGLTGLGVNPPYLPFRTVEWVMQEGFVIQKHYLFCDMCVYNELGVELTPIEVVKPCWYLEVALHEH